MKKRRRRKRSLFEKTWEILMSLFVATWPVVIGLLTVHPRLYESSRKWWEILWSPDKHFADYKIDKPIAFMWTVTIIWPFVYFFSEKRKDKLHEQEKEENKAAILSVINIRSFNAARKHLDKIAKLLSELDKYEEELKQGDYENIDEVATHLAAANSLTNNVISAFFNLGEEHIGSNIMIYIEKHEIPKNLMLKLLEKENIFNIKCLYARKDHMDKLLGILYLSPDLIDLPHNEDVKLPDNQLEILAEKEITIPIYQLNSKIYNSKKCLRDDITLPGAPTAFFHGQSFVGNTKDHQEYETFNDETIQEILNYFNEEASEIRSFASFAIPHKTAVNKCVGIFNVQSSITDDFDREKEYFNALYTMLYPVWKHSSKYLEFYKKFIINDLQQALTDQV